MRHDVGKDEFFEITSNHRTTIWKEGRMPFFGYKVVEKWNKSSEGVNGRNISKFKRLHVRNARMGSVDYSTRA